MAVKIAVVASPVTPLLPAQLGGAQAFVSDLAQGLATRGHDVTLHCADGSAVRGVRLAMVPVPRDASTALVMPGGGEPPPSPGVAAALEAMFGSIGDDVDVVSQHAFDAPAFELARDLPVLHTLHLPPIVASVVEAARGLSPARLAAVSHASAASWARAGIEVGEVLPNGVPDYPTSRVEAERVALVAGRISPEKGIEDAIAAARACGIPVRLAGAHYDPGYAPDLDGVELLGPLRRAELRRVMQASAVTICAVRWDEPFGMVAAEAQMA
ncbi:MAG TPA: glycosyltransferase, partial [Candidatus Dormibacteraeota bacterium]|nr:glycosyltransferase [Candidatus Dormibacteraeota bacterium]